MSLKINSLQLWCMSQSTVVGCSFEQLLLITNAIFGNYLHLKNCLTCAL
ncbi:hypothetical protein X975_05913, partial [Stegodyphus mimosarum]